jgi:hypothetical protein
MVAETILCNLSDANETIAETRDEWIIEVLLALGVPEDTIELGFDDVGRDDYIYEMNELGISVELYSTGEVDVYKKVWITGKTEESSGWLPPTKQHIVAQWKNPERVRRVDGNEVYYELHLREWSTKKMRIL